MEGVSVLASHAPTEGGSVLGKPPAGYQVGVPCFLHLVGQTLTPLSARWGPWQDMHGGSFFTVCQLCEWESRVRISCFMCVCTCMCIA